nr:hypothetical protein [Tanacetum cinerariifolium]
MTANKIDVTDKACEEYFQEVLGFFDVIASGSPTPFDDPIVSTTSSTLTLFRDSDFLLFKEANAFLGLEDDPDSPELDPSYCDLEGDIQMLKAILNSDPTPSLLNHEQYVELKDLPPHLEYAFLEGDNKLPVIIAKELGDKEKAALIKFLKSHKRAIAWKLSDIQDGFSGFFQIPFDPRDQEKTTFTFPYGTFAYRRMPGFIKDFSKISRSMTHLLEKDTPFIFPEDCIKAFQTLKQKLTKALILIAPNWDLPFELMCDACDFIIGAENLAADHLSRLEKPYENVLDPKEINATFPLQTLSTVTFRGDSSASWFADLANYHAATSQVAEASAKNLVPIQSEYEVTSDDEKSHCLNVESNFVESLSNHDTLKFDHLEELSRAFMPIHMAKEDRIRREHAEYISLMEREDIDIVTDTDELSPSGFENDDYDPGEIDVVEELLVDNPIPRSENELSDFNHDDPLFPRPPSEPPDAEFDLEPDSGEVISAVINTIDELECLDPGREIDVSTYVEDDNYFPFIIVIRIFLPYLIYPKVFPFLLSAKSEDTIFDPSISV